MKDYSELQKVMDEVVNDMNKKNHTEELERLNKIFNKDFYSCFEDGQKLEEGKANNEILYGRKCLTEEQIIEPWILDRVRNLCKAYEKRGFISKKESAAISELQGYIFKIQKLHVYKKGEYYEEI